MVRTVRNNINLSQIKKNCLQSEIRRQVSESKEQLKNRLVESRTNSHTQAFKESKQIGKKQQVRIRKLKYLARETPEQREKRLAQDRKRKAQQLASETPEQREIRLAKAREHKARLRVTETPQQREIRLAVERKRKRRAKLRSLESYRQRQIRLEAMRKLDTLQQEANLTLHEDNFIKQEQSQDFLVKIENHEAQLIAQEQREMCLESDRRQKFKLERCLSSRKRKQKCAHSNISEHEMITVEMPTPKKSKKRERTLAEVKRHRDAKIKKRRSEDIRKFRAEQRAKESQDQREVRLASERKRIRPKIPESPEVREKRLEIDRRIRKLKELENKYLAVKHKCTTESNPKKTMEQCELQLEEVKNQRAQLLAKRREMLLEIEKKLKGDLLDASQEGERPKKVRKKRDPRKYETPKARENRLAADRARKAQLRALETPEEREIRLETDRKLKALQREAARQQRLSETPEECETRLAEYKKRKEHLLAEMRELKRLAAAREQSWSLEPQEVLEVHIEEGKELQLQPCETTSAELPDCLSETPLIEYYLEEAPKQHEPSLAELKELEAEAPAEMHEVCFATNQKCDKQTTQVLETNVEPDRNIKLSPHETSSLKSEETRSQESEQTCPQEIPENLVKSKRNLCAYEPPKLLENRLVMDQESEAQLRALGTPKELLTPLEKDQKAQLRQRAKKILDQLETRVGATSIENAHKRVAKYCRSGSNSAEHEVQAEKNIKPGTSGVKQGASRAIARTPSTSGTMETGEVTSDVTIKNEIDIEEERLIRVKTEVPDVIVAIPQSANYLNAETHQLDTNSLQSSSITIKLEPEFEPRENNYLVERDDIADKPTLIREAEPSIPQTNVNIKQENNESIVTYDYPSFDDGGSMDSSEAEALGQVETCLQDDINIKSENGVHLEEPHKEEFLDTNVKMESVTTETKSSNEILPDNISEHTKYSFVMKIPGDVVCNIDEMITSCITNGVPIAHTTDFETYLDNETITDDTVMKTSKESLNYTIEDTNLLQESDKSETVNLNPFQLNSITGDVLPLEQEAYNMMKPKNVSCPKCPKNYRQKRELTRHLKVHQTIDNYRKGWKKTQETRRLKKKKHPPDTDSDHQEKLKEIKTESKEGYKCTCGKSFRRKTRMESCLRSHDCCESEKYYCMTCLKDFRSKDELALHRKRLHRKKFPCKFCPTDYATRKKLFKHLQIHQKVNQMEYKVIEEVVKGKKLSCFLCSKFYTEISELKIHVMTEHKGPYSCPHCKNTFPKIIDFGNHTKTYHPEVGSENVLDVLEAFSRLTQEWKCEECGLQFLEADKLALHQVEQHSPELKSEHQFQCPDCRRVFVSQKGLTSHRRIHHSIETSEQTKVEVCGIMCLECRKMCKDMTALTSHMRFHSPDRKYPCKFCDFRFATQEKRKTHAEIHTGEMKYVCFICEYQCSSENRLKTHKHSLKHQNMREYLLTGKPLIEPSTSDDKDKHVGKKGNSKEVSESDSGNSDVEEVSCDVCGEKFPGESAMLEHKETHPFIEIPSDDKPTRIFFK